MKMDKMGAVIKGVLGAYILTGIILLVLTFLMYRFNPTGEILRVGIVFTYIFSTFIGGLLTGKKIKERRFLWGIAVGILYFLVIFLVSLVLGRDVFGEAGKTAMVFIMCTLGGMLGGMVS